MILIRLVLIKRYKIFNSEQNIYFDLFIYVI